jgi:hypothetical protein
MNFAEVCTKLKAQNRSEYLFLYAVEEGALPKLLGKMTPPFPNAGAGAQIRQHKTDLKYLGASRLIRHLGGKHDGIDARRNSNITRESRSRVIADAMVLTQERLGVPLLFPEQKWELACRRVEAILAGGYSVDSVRGVLF